MAIAIPAGCHRQPVETTGRDANGDDTLSYVLKGPYDALDTLLRSLGNGDEIIRGWCLSSASLARNAGDVGTLTLVCAADGDDAEAGGPTENSTRALSEVWTLRAIRNDVSILGYCGPSEGTNPQRTWIEAWQKEPDGELAAALKFTRPDGSVVTIDGQTATADVIRKILKGVDSVMRFYPQLTRTRTFTHQPATVYENLATVDVPRIGSTTDFEDADGSEQKASARRLQKPGNLAEVIADHEWLKCQDDVARTADGRFTRTESWIGVLKSDGGWDKDLYGKDGRWAMPYTKGG